MPTLVLVHIGSHFPDYINDCISKIVSVSSINIHLLISKEHFNSIKENITLIALEDITSSIYTQQFESISKLDSSSRGGFWKYATMRFFYLYDYILSTGLTDIFHIENDNLIYFDFLEKINYFREKNMWCVMDSTIRCIPSFLYFKDSDIIRKLLDTCIIHSSRGSNDMFALGEFRNNNSDVGVLPICGTYDEPIDSIFYEYACKFNCIFDAAAVGQYIGGVDPRNQDGDTIGFINETSPVKCNRAKVEWIEKKPYLNGLPLVNLHIHSKDLKRWM